MPRIAVVGNHLPRRCGIATFTASLADALIDEACGADAFVVAMNDGDRLYPYPARVRAQVAEQDIVSYRHAAEFINRSGADVVSIQHEFGIFGGLAGGHVLELMRALHAPIVTTLHTVLAEPTATQRLVFEGVIERSERLVVMSHTGAEMLTELYDVPTARIDVIPHGSPEPSAHGNVWERLELDPRPLLFTFGLLSPDKGIEHVIDALPEIIAAVPDVLYVVLGATHPHVLMQQGERYRQSLEQRAHTRGVEAHLRMLNRFASPEEVGDFLAAADLYVTPYLNMEQITSGTLAYAFGAGKAVISTPYSHARELLAEGSGVLVPPRDPVAIAAAVKDLLASPARRQALSERALQRSRDAAWPRVARRYCESFAEARRGHALPPRTARPKHVSEHLSTLPASDLRHVDGMTDATGLIQHAVFNVPRYNDGYCLDDNARALLLTTRLDTSGSPDERSYPLANRYLAFLHHAFDSETGRFRNFMSYARRWTERCGSEDCHGRALWALGNVVRHSGDRGHRAVADELFRAALPATLAFTSPRAWAFTVLGIEEYLRVMPRHEVAVAAREAFGERLLGLFRSSSSADWPWFEDRATYDNARLSQAAMLCGAAVAHEEMISVGLRSLEWLTNRQRSEDGGFAPIGSNGFYPRGGPSAAFDQQPVEAYAMVSASLTAFRVSHNIRWLVDARRAFDWFLGGNVLRVPLFDVATGGCRDGLHEDRVNENQGAEATLSFQLSLFELRSEISSLNRPTPDPS